MLFNRNNIIAIFSKLIFAFLWAYILGWLCSKGYKSISWFLVLLPFIMIFLVSFGIMRHVREVNKLNPMMN
jgi:F0F1-type ATP synthase assembly protein I